MSRNINIENRINKRRNHDKLYKINSYGGMGMDGISENERQLRLEELDYIKKHPEIYKKPEIYKNQQPIGDKSTYLINLI
jgi:hypothetical protein